MEVACDSNGVLFLAYHLYDADGRLTAKSDGFERCEDELTICCDGGEQLLHVPRDRGAAVRYRLYSSAGMLLTWSDGVRTKIYPNLRMDGIPRGWALPSA